ncbi:MAG: hypothetical protein OJF59_003310 [Cytophagales bacterium]|jgi:hypothetical protein|nr:TonB-dependent receptor [Bacteroidota bacterium]MBS1982158.1 TonB-dependent receptor [Bacteroidota bacterium]WHZ09554.1 MAG: hypothetical protein OJF59_003310 [Cytophagales bacterium]
MICRKIYNRPLSLAAACWLLGSFFSVSGQAQDQKEKWGEGEIEKVEIQITKNRQITLPQASRNFEKVPPRPAEPIKPAIAYQYKTISFNTPDYSPAIRPLKLKDEPLSKTYGNYLSAGFGNYSSPYAEAYFTNKRDKNKSYGAKLYHRSFMTGPVDGKNSASGNTELRVFGKSMNNYVALSGFADYENITTHFYGYPPGHPVDKSSILQSYNIFSLGGEVENSRSSDFKYSLKGGYSYLSDHYSASENAVNVDLSSQYKIDNNRRLLIDADIFLMDRKDNVVASKMRQVVKVKPSYQFSPIDNLSLTAGFNAVVENDTIGKQNGVHVYPNVAADYTLSNAVQAYASLTGDIDRVSLHSLARENAWINSNINLFNTNRTLEFLAGLRGQLSGKVSYGAGFSFANLKNLYYYQLDTTKHSQNKFNVFYDNGSTQRISFFGELNYTSEAFAIGLRGDYFSYSTSMANQIASFYGITNPSLENVALHRPTYRVAINSTYNIYDKIILSANFIAQGGINALDVKTKRLITLNPAADLNFKINYKVSKQFSLFLDFNNILSSNYQLYMNYPVRAFQVLGGASWNF